MVLDISVYKINGRRLRICLHNWAKVGDLKVLIYARTGITCNKQSLLVLPGTGPCVDDNDYLLDLAEWFILGDLIDHYELIFLKIPMMLQLVEKPRQWLVEKPRQCAYCNNMEGRLKRCERCRRVKYCSVICQRAHWPLHHVYCTHDG